MATNLVKSTDDNTPAYLNWFESLYKILLKNGYHTFALCVAGMGIGIILCVSAQFMPDFIYQMVAGSGAFLIILCMIIFVALLIDVSFPSSKKKKQKRK